MSAVVEASADSIVDSKSQFSKIMSTNFGESISKFIIFSSQVSQKEKISRNLKKFEALNSICVKIFLQSRNGSKMNRNRTGRHCTVS